MQSFVIVSLMMGVTIGATEDSGMAVYFALTGLPWTHVVDVLLADVGQTRATCSQFALVLHWGSWQQWWPAPALAAHLDNGGLGALIGSTCTLWATGLHRRAAPF